MGATAGQAVVWYSGQFYALFFLQNVLKVDGASVNKMVAISLLLGTGFFVFFGWLSDKIGRKPIIMAGLALAILTYFPLFKALTEAANPALATAQVSSVATVTADPKDCHFQFNPTGTIKFTSSCDIATSFLTKNSVPYKLVEAPAGTVASIAIGANTVASFDAVAAGDKAKGMGAAFEKGANLAMQAGGYPLVRDPAKVVASKLDALATANPEAKVDVAAVTAGDKTMMKVADAVTAKLLTDDEAKAITDAEVAVYAVPGAGAFKMVADPAGVNWTKIIGILTILVIYVTMVYGPIAAWLVEMFPTRIRYTGMSLPYHIGNGWFGGLLPAIVFAMSAAKGDIYYGLWYPIIIAAMTLVIGLLFVKDNKRNVELENLD